LLDSDRQLLEERFLDDSSKLVLNENGYAVEKDEYSDNGLQITRSYFDDRHRGLTPLRKCYDSYISTMNRVDTFLVYAYNPYNSIYFGRA
jgi:hypothetical protein